MARKFQISRMLRKGFEGAFLAGGATEAVLRTLDVKEAIPTIDGNEHMLVVLATAIFGALLKCLKNWLKNKGRK